MRAFAATLVAAVAMSVWGVPHIGTFVASETIEHVETR